MAHSVFRADDLADAAVGLTIDVVGAEARHMSVVRRLGPGDVVDVVDGRGRRVTGGIVAASPQEVTIRVDLLADELAADPALTVVQALIKGERAERAVESLTEVGVDVIVPWAAQRCVVEWDQRRVERGLARWRASAAAASKQARRSWDPIIRPPVTTPEVLALVASADLALVLDADADLPLARVTVPQAGRIVVVVGPEGGLTPEEIASLTQAGAAPARLGPTVLRAATAGTVAAAVLLAHTAAWTGSVAGSGP